MISDSRHKIRHSLTEHNNGYKLVSVYIDMGYNGLLPTPCKLVHLLFAMTIKNIHYPKKGQVQECKNRIHTCTLITVDTLLDNANSKKYSDGKKMENDRSNCAKQIVSLHDQNIYYHWKYDKFYIFIMERELGSWTYYNDYGYVTPCTMKKILVRADDMLHNMPKHVKQSGGVPDHLDIRNSFGAFMDGMAWKMHPLVAASLPKWKDGNDLEQYLGRLGDKIETLNKFEGLEEDPKFIDKLPALIRNKYISGLRKDKMKEDKKKVAKEKALAKELVPKGESSNLAKKPRKPRKKNKKTTPVSSDGKPIKQAYTKVLKPFEDSNDLIKYYRAFLQQYSGNARILFGNFACDTAVATELLDLLKERGRDNKAFLDAWLEYFHDHKLKGGKIYKKESTEMRQLLYSFERFNEIYYIPQ